MDQTLKSFAAPILAILQNERFGARISYRDAQSGQWVVAPETSFIMSSVTSIPKVAADICLSTTLRPDDGTLVFDYIPGKANMAQLVGIFLSFDTTASHLKRYGGSLYFTHRATEVRSSPPPPPRPLFLTLS